MFTFGCIKRGATAAIMDDSRPSEPVAKRTRLVTGCSGAEVHNGGDKESTLSQSLMWMTDFSAICHQFAVYPRWNKLRSHVQSIAQLTLCQVTGEEIATATKI